MSKELIERLRGLRCFGPEHFALLYEAAELIEAQQKRIDELELQRPLFSYRHFKEKSETLGVQLAAAQAQIKVMREALEKIVECDFWEDVREIIAEALAQPEGV